jgi:hypothetical protein
MQARKPAMMDLVHSRGCDRKKRAAQASQHGQKNYVTLWFYSQ